MLLRNEWEMQWEGEQSSSFTQDWINSLEAEDDMREYVVVSTKQIPFRQALFELAAYAQILSLFPNKPVIHSIFGVLALATLTPVSIAMLSDEEAIFLDVIGRLQEDEIVNEVRLRALLGIQTDADLLIGTLVEKGFIKRFSTGTLKIQKRVLTNFKIGSKK